MPLLGATPEQEVIDLPGRSRGISLEADAEPRKTGDLEDPGNVWGGRAQNELTSMVKGLMQLDQQPDAAAVHERELRQIEGHLARCLEQRRQVGHRSVVRREVEFADQAGPRPVELDAESLVTHQWDSTKGHG